MLDLFIASVIDQATAGLNVPPEARRYVDAASRLVQTAVTQWRAVAASGARCSVCRDQAISACLKCGGMCCLAHSFVSAVSGQSACTKCLGVEVREPPPRVRPNGHAGSNGNGHAPTARDDTATRRRHLKTLKLDEFATDEEVHAAFRAFAAKYHPDKAKPAQRDAWHKRFTTVSEAYNWLRTHPQEASA